MEDEQKVDIIFDSKEQKMITVIKEANMYMEMPLKTNLEQSNKSTDDQNYKRTGNKKKILGYDCEEVHFKNNKEDIEMWVSQENIPFMGIGGNGMPGQEQKSSFSSLSNLKMGFPFLIIAKSNGSTSRFEVTSIEKKSLDNSMFTIPSGFQKMDMNMMKQMK
ncbi:MAG: DUF4412 domain-containing protein [Bacteroidetes bacterium]|nr:MAG: DUF4412 domain-containing protein [Bacteroidota bacterium]